MKEKQTILSGAFFILIASFALIKPDSLKYIGLAYLDYFLMFFDVILLILLLLFITTYRVSKQSLIIMLMYGFMIISTILHTGSFSFLIKTVGPAFAICLYTDYCMQKCPFKFVQVNFYLWSILYILNYMTILLFPDGIYVTSRLSGSCWLLGYDNGFTLTLIPLVGFAMIYSYLKKGELISIETFCSIAILLVTEITVWSASGIVMAAILLIFIFASNVPVIKKLTNPHLLIFIFYIATILLVFVRVLNLFEFLIVDILHKDITLTGRTYIWDYAISVFKKNWLLGVGQGGFTVIGKYNSYLHPHCLILDFLYKGGSCMLLSFIWLMHKFCNHIEKYLKNPISKVVLMVVVSLLMGEIANSSQYKPYLWSFIVMSAYIPEFLGEEKMKNEFVRFKGNIQ